MCEVTRDVCEWTFFQLGLRTSGVGVLLLKASSLAGKLEERKDHTCLKADEKKPLFLFLVENLNRF